MMNQKEIEQMQELAARITAIRDACGFSAEEIAAELGIDLPVYQEYGQSGANIPISVIYHIANKCRVDLAEILTGSAARLTTYHVVKKGQGQTIARYPGYQFKDLAFRYNQKIMQPLLVAIDPSDQPAALVCHNGQEFNLVLKGEMIFAFGDKEIPLSAGDSVYFNATHPHGQKNAGSEPLLFLTVIAE